MRQSKYMDKVKLLLLMARLSTFSEAIEIVRYEELCTGSGHYEQFFAHIRGI